MQSLKPLECLLHRGSDSISISHSSVERGKTKTSSLHRGREEEHNTMLDELLHKQQSMCHSTVMQMLGWLDFGELYASCLQQTRNFLTMSLLTVAPSHIVKVYNTLTIRRDLQNHVMQLLLPFLSQHSWYNVLADMIIFRSLLKMAWQLPNKIMIFSETTSTIQHTSHIVLVLWCSWLTLHRPSSYNSRFSLFCDTTRTPQIWTMFVHHMYTPPKASAVFSIQVLQLRNKIWC
jgi:hypothetical protein